MHLAASLSDARGNPVDFIDHHDTVVWVQYHARRCNRVGVCRVTSDDAGGDYLVDGVSVEWREGRTAITIRLAVSRTQSAGGNCRVTHPYGISQWRILRGESWICN